MFSLDYIIVVRMCFSGLVFCVGRKRCRRETILMEGTRERGM